MTGIDLDRGEATELAELLTLPRFPVAARHVDEARVQERPLDLAPTTSCWLHAERPGVTL